MRFGPCLQNSCSVQNLYSELLDRGYKRAGVKYPFLDGPSAAFSRPDRCCVCPCGWKCCFSPGWPVQLLLPALRLCCTCAGSTGKHLFKVYFCRGAFMAALESRCMLFFDEWIAALWFFQNGAVLSHGFAVSPLPLFTELDTSLPLGTTAEGCQLLGLQQHAGTACSLPRLLPQACPASLLPGVFHYFLRVFVPCVNFLLVWTASRKTEQGVTCLW